MLKKVGFLVLFFVLAISCGQNGGVGPGKTDLLCAVPVDADLVCILDDCASDSLTDFLFYSFPFDLSLLKGHNAVLSKVGLLGDHTLMILDVTGSDPVELIKCIRNSGCFCQLVSSEQGYMSGTALVVCESEMLVKSSLNNLSSGTSILDAQGFREALAASPDKETLVISKGVWKKQSLSQWIVLSKSDDTTYDIVFSAPRSYSFLSTVLSDMGTGESQLGLILPSDSNFIIDLAISDPGDFLSLRYRNLDACSELTRAQNESSALKKKYGMDPLDWARCNSLVEAAMVQWGSDGKQVVLLRSTKSGVSHRVKSNRMQGYCKAFLGDMFAIRDDSSVACLGYWNVFGSKDDVTDFLNCESRGKSFVWPQKDIKLAVYDSDKLIVVGKNSAWVQLNCE